jgi:hypothetical protein
VDEVEALCTPQELIRWGAVLLMRRERARDDMAFAVARGFGGK